MPSTIASRLNNPGNLKDSATGAWRSFASPQEGYAALLNDLQAKQVGTTTTGLGPDSSLVDFASKYAPANDGNNVGQYAANLANQLGVAPNAKLKELDLAKWAAAVAHNEDASSLFGNQKIIQGAQAPTPQPQTFGEKTGEVAKGFGKGVLGDLYGASAFSAGPVGQAMLDNAPALKQQVEQSVKPAMQTQNTYQTIGLVGEKLASLALPGAGVKSGIEASRVANVGKESLDLASESRSLRNIRKGLVSLGESPQTQKDAQVIQPLVQQGLLRARYTAQQTMKNVSVLKDAIISKATALKNALIQNDVPYIYKELASALKSVKLPGLLKNNEVLAKTYSEVINGVVQQAKTMPAKISNVLELRKWLDEEVARQFGDIYSSTRDLTPVRQAVKATRDALHSFIESKAPSVGLKNSLSEQSSLYNVLDNVATKGAPDVKRAEQMASIPGIRGLMARHPVATKAIETGLGVMGGATLLGGFQTLKERLGVQ